MDILNKLPYDLQEKIINKYEADEKIRTLIRQSSIALSFIDCYQLCSYISCDSNNFVWYSSHTIIGEEDFYNIPLGYLYSVKQIKDIVQKWKEVFFEYLRYNYTYSKENFKKIENKKYEILYGLNYPKKEEIIQRIKTKYLCKIIKQEWFSDDLLEKVKNDSVMINELSNIKYKRTKRFQVEDSHPDMGCCYIGEPYPVHFLERIQNKCPIIYKCLEEYDQLYSLNYKLPFDFKTYTKLYLQLEKAMDDYHKKHGYISCDTDFKGFEDIDPPEVFNEKVKATIPDYNFTIKYCHFDYLAMPRLCEIVLFEKKKFFGNGIV